MSSLVSRRARAATASLLLASVALSGCSILGGARNSTDISKLPNIPEGKMVGTELVAVDPPSIIDQTFKLDPKGKTVVNKDDKIYLMMSATDYWRLGQDTYDLCVEQDCEYYSSWTVDVEGSGADLTYVWTLKVDGDDQPKEPLVRRFKVGK